MEIELNNNNVLAFEPGKSKVELQTTYMVKIEGRGFESWKIKHKLLSCMSSIQFTC